MSSNKSIQVLEQLGRGLSVNTICTRLQITYDELCLIAADDHKVYNELQKWYPSYDFTVKPLGQSYISSLQTNPAPSPKEDEKLQSYKITEKKHTRAKKKASVK